MVKREALTALVVELAKWHLDHPCSDDFAGQESAAGIDRLFVAPRWLCPQARGQLTRLGRSLGSQRSGGGHQLEIGHAPPHRQGLQPNKFGITHTVTPPPLGDARVGSATPGRQHTGWSAPWWGRDLRLPDARRNRPPLTSDCSFTL